MGYSRKEEIARLKQEHKKAKASKKRQEHVRDKRVRFLIVCEGTRTEPLYFKSLIEDYTSTVREVNLEGEGMATVALVDRALTIKKELEYYNGMKFDRVWVVFDKDDFDDFNEAIIKAKKLGFQSAWTNEAFELWYYLHFEYLDTGITREAYIKKLQDFIRAKSGDNTFKYKKKDPMIYSILKQYGNEELAKRHAKKLRGLHKGDNYAEHKPSTKIDLLVDELENPEKLIK